MLMKLPKNAYLAKLHAKSVNSQPHNAPGAYQGIHLVHMPHLTQLLSASKIVPLGHIWTRLMGCAYPVSPHAILVMTQLHSAYHASQTISGWKENLSAIRNVLLGRWLCKAPHSA
jgi:hypothetical protein